MKRAIIIVIDSAGIGAMKDCAEYGDLECCNTICNTAKAVGGLSLPEMGKMGLGNLADIKGVAKTQTPTAKYGVMLEKSKGKDTTTGHWELMGLVLDKPFETYPDGFPEKLINEFIEKTGCKGVLGNCAASGTAIIEELHAEHEKTHFPIVYTSADSVFQIAVDVDITPIETLYKWCEAAREILDSGYSVSRVIARPYKMLDGEPTRISKDRRDYSVPPPAKTLLNEIVENNGITIGIGKIEDIFVKSGITHAIHTGTNAQGLDLTLKAIKNELDLNDIRVQKAAHNPDKSLIFTNLVDTDMLYGHRNDPQGYAKALEEIDLALKDILEAMNEDDILIITADHGCDPTTKGTDHTREQVPVLVYSKNIKPESLGILPSFDFAAKTVREHLFERDLVDMDEFRLF